MIEGESYYLGEHEEFNRCVDIETVDTMGEEQSDDMWMMMHCMDDHTTMQGAMKMMGSSLVAAASLIALTIY